MWPQESYFLSPYLFSFLPFMGLTHSDHDLLGSGTVSRTYAWLFQLKSPWPPWLHEYGMRISCTKAKSIRYSSHVQIHCYDVTQNYWALRLSLLYVMSWCNSFIAPSVLRDPLYFSLLVTQKPLQPLQPQTMLNVSVSRKIFNDSWISPFHIT